MVDILIMAIAVLGPVSLIGFMLFVYLARR